MFVVPFVVFDKKVHVQSRQQQQLGHGLFGFILSVTQFVADIDARSARDQTGAKGHAQYLPPGVRAGLDGMGQIQDQSPQERDVQVEQPVEKPPF